MNTGQQTNPNPPNAAGGNISGQQNPASQTSNQQPQTTQNQQGGQPNLNQSASGAQTSTVKI